MTTPDGTRTAMAGGLRSAAADLIDARQDIPLPWCSIAFYLRGEYVPATMAAIVSALPCPWHADIARGSGGQWLHPRHDGPGGSTVNPGAQVNIGGNAAGAWIQAGANTLTIWQPGEAMTRLLGDRPVEGAR